MVEGNAKRNTNKRYKFGCKVTMVGLSKDNWVAGIKEVDGNTYNGHTLKASMEQAKRIEMDTPRSKLRRFSR